MTGEELGLYSMLFVSLSSSVSAPRNPGFAAFWDLTPADRDSDKEPYAEGNPNGCQGMLFGLFADPV